LLQDIIAELARSDDDLQPIAAATVRRWMSSNDPEVRGATSTLLFEGRHWDMITPPLDYDEEFDWMLDHFELCLRTDPQGEWIKSRWSAGNDLLVWFVALWDQGWDAKYVQGIKALLARLYTTGSADLKECIEQATVEHLFERQEVREFFKDWEGHPQLGPAHAAGLKWALGGGKSPYWLPRQAVRQVSFDEYFEQKLNYFASLMQDDPKPRWTDIEDSGGWDLPRWFVRLWDEGRDRKYFERVRDILEELYPTGTPELKGCIEQAVLGAMFEREPLRQLFESWRDNPQLGPAYEAGLRWVREAGRKRATE